MEGTTKLTLLQRVGLERQRINTRLEQIIEAAETLDPDDPDTRKLLGELVEVRTRLTTIYRTDWNCR